MINTRRLLSGFIQICSYLTSECKKHYSTFSLYKEKELEEAIKGFHKNIKRDFVNFDDIEWFDENILLILKG